MEASPSHVPWAQVAGFVRQLGHDIRNDLNALSLEAALLKELVTDPEAVTSASRIQAQLREAANRLKDLSSRYALAHPQVTPHSLASLSSQLELVDGLKNVHWTTSASPRVVSTDPVLLGLALQEIVRNSAIHGKDAKVSVTVGEDGSGGGVVDIFEANTAFYEWPATPFAAPRAGKYGAGLYMASLILHELGAQLQRKEANGGMATRIVLPAA